MKHILTILSVVIFSQVAFSQKNVSFPNIETIVDTAKMELKPGSHKIIIKYTVNRKSTYDTVDLEIWPDSSRYHINQLPFAEAGEDFTWPLGKTATLTGGGFDIDGTIASWKWRKVAGPTKGKISYATRKSTTVTGVVAGTYIYELEITDNNAGMARDTLKVTFK